MRLRIFAITALLALSDVGHSKGLPETLMSSSGREETILSATLSHLNLKDPGQDARERVAAGDLRPVGLNGYTCIAPGLKPDGLPRAGSIRCLDGTADMIASQEHTRLMEAARAYAVAYNLALVRLVNEKK